MVVVVSVAAVVGVARSGPVRVAAYVYPGWHPIPERDEAFHPGFTEWELVEACRPRFDGHHQPRVPALGPYDDRDPDAVLFVEPGLQKNLLTWSRLPRPSAMRAPR